LSMEEEEATREKRGGGEESELEMTATRFAFITSLGPSNLRLGRGERKEEGRTIGFPEAGYRTAPSVGVIELHPIIGGEEKRGGKRH